ncbi:NRDE family protein [Dyadobacter jiangsuensis]|uniref:Transport and Golgi organization protein 2 n=1 Tax=Dyadobacter jiangsuensis TaxID=1591085 RepID=A0A2P8GJ58_9BACT|nr:NRDE family protein [Dyadobacter jiangsuensis]PSL33991.1 transport and Golgi organization protein 2 [Dyadobacter jiangsuensis]
MCTVTYIPTSKGAFLTSNRDERTDRAPAEPPATRHAGASLTYPKDAQAGGTWIALKGRRDAAVLLNGGFKNHVRKPSYNRSRGLVMLEIVEASSPADCFETTVLEGIEPFTLILFTDGRLMRCTWDGSRKHRNELDAHQPHIWASATLYNDDARQMRAQRLQQWYGKSAVTRESILDFHTQNGIMFDPSHSCHEHRDAIATVSVTSVDLTGPEPAMHYHDLRAGTTFVSRPAEAPPGEQMAFDSLRWKARRFLIRLRNWEYWPLECVYAPTLPAWLWLSIKARAICFFGAANPSMRYAGFAEERKSRIYALMPKGSYPETLVCEAGIPREKIQMLLQRSSFTFPLIAKPDIGERGVQVKLLENETDLEDYRLHSRVDFLMQPYIDYPNEAGIFYHRMPGEQSGHISGIVGKELLSVTGDGASDILTLMMQDDRAILQLPALHESLGERLRSVPARGEKIGLVPYGNHSRGAKFIDLSRRITPALTQAIDRICARIPGFHFGRLDIRFKSWEALEAGQHFSIIELNGAASEPTHIYDPQHSLFFAWKEIYRHWKILFEISMANAKKGAPQMTLRDGVEMVREHQRHLKLMRCHRIRRFENEA